MKLAYVEWFDCLWMRGPVVRHRADIRMPIEARTGGLLIDESDAGLTIAQDEFLDDDSVRSVAFIPTALIRRVVIWEIPTEGEDDE